MKTILTLLVTLMSFIGFIFSVGILEHDAIFWLPSSFAVFSLLVLALSLLKLRIIEIRPYLYLSTDRK